MIDQSDRERGVGGLELAGPALGVDGVERAGDDLDEHLVVGQGRHSRGLVELEHAGVPVRVVHPGLHHPGHLRRRHRGRGRGRRGRGRRHAPPRPTSSLRSCSPSPSGGVGGDGTAAPLRRRRREDELHGSLMRRLRQE